MASRRNGPTKSKNPTKLANMTLLFRRKRGAITGREAYRRSHMQNRTRRTTPTKSIAIMDAVGMSALTIRISSETCWGCRRRMRWSQRHQCRDTKRGSKHGYDESTRSHSPFPHRLLVFRLNVSGNKINATALPSNTSPTRSSCSAARCNLTVHRNSALSIDAAFACELPLECPFP